MAGGRRAGELGRGGGYPPPARPAAPRRLALPLLPSVGAAVFAMRVSCTAPRMAEEEPPPPTLPPAPAPAPAPARCLLLALLWPLLLA